LQDAAQTPIGVTNVRERAWLTHFIQRPDEVLAAKDPIATPLFSKHKQVQMPNLRLGPEDSATRVEISTRCVDIRTLPWP
jgi:protein SCO1/2